MIVAQKKHWKLEQICENHFFSNDASEKK